MELTQIAEIVATWAAQKPLIKRVYLFGSRVRETSNESSDLDVAIELDQSACRDECLGMAIWICETQAWKAELDAVIPHEVQVVRYAGNDTPVIDEALKESHLLVYEKQ